MPRELSLKLRTDFKRLYKHGIRKGSKNFQLIFIDADNLKFGFLVAKKDIPKSSDRIYSKRIVRNIVYKDILGLFETKKMHICISIKTNLKVLRKSVKYQDLRNEITDLFKQINFNAPAFKKDQKRTFHDKRSFRSSPKSTRNG